MPSGKCTPATSVSTVTASEPVDREHRSVVADAEDDVAVAVRTREVTRDDFELADQGALLGCTALTRSSREALVEHRVDELVAIGGAVALRELHGFVDDDLARHVVAKLELCESEQQDRSPDGVELVDAARGLPRDDRVERRNVVDDYGEQLTEEVAVAAREVLVRGELRRDLGDAVPGDLPLIERFDEQLSGQVPCSSTALTRQACYSSWRSTVAI